VSAYFAVAVCGVMKLVQRPAVWLLASVATLAIACDRDSPSKDSGDSSGSPIVLHGGERLGWDQAAVSNANPASYTYTMYIDGSPRTLPDVSCSSAGSAYACSSLLPSMSLGRHTLTLVASQGNSQSPPSRPLEVNMVVAATLPQEVSEAKPIAQPRCSGSGTCFRSTELLRSPGLISTPVSALNGRILFVVDGRQIQSVTPASKAPTVLLDVESPAARILSLAVPWSGSDGGSLVWVASTETRVDDTRVLTITRYRLVEDTLGEAAVVVSMRIPKVEPRVVVDNDSHIYIAMPSTETNSASVWRLMADGTTPRSQPSPELLSVPPELRAIALAPEGQLWVSGADDTGRWQFSHIESPDADARFQSVAPAPDDRQSPGSDISSMAFIRGAGAGRAESSVLAVASGALYRASARGSVLGSMQRIPLPRGTPIEVAADDGGLYVVTIGTLNDGSATYALFRLIP
jgi:hypothetical protein